MRDAVTPHQLGYYKRGTCAVSRDCAFDGGRS